MTTRHLAVAVAAVAISWPLLRGAGVLLSTDFKIQDQYIAALKAGADELEKKGEKEQAEELLRHAADAASQRTEDVAYSTTALTLLGIGCLAGASWFVIRVRYGPRSANRPEAVNTLDRVFLSVLATLTCAACLGLCILIILLFLISMSDS